MKATTLYATLCLMLGSAAAFSKSDDSTRCAQCVQKDRKISELQNENDRLKGLKETPKLASEAAAAEKQTTSSYKVRAGDTLERISRRTGCSVLALGKANGLKSSTIIHPGQVLKVPTSGAAPVAAAKAPVTSSGSYTVKDGDTYTSISKKTGVSISSLASANPKVKPTALRTGQVIQLRTPATAPAALAKAETPSPVRTISNPSVKTISNSEPLVIPRGPVSDKPEPAAKPQEPKPAPAPTATPEPKPAAEPKPTPAPVAEAPKPAAQPPAPASPPMGNAKTTVRAIIIQDETSFAEFASSHGTTPESLNELNGLSLSNGTVLAKGSELYIPAQP